MAVHRSQTIAALALEHNWQRGAELGVYDGATLGYVLENVPQLHMVAVDLWARTPGPPKNKETGEADYTDKPMEAAYAKVLEISLKFPERCVILKMSTREAVFHVEDNTLDFIFVDASHTTRNVMMDILMWRPKVKAGGFLMGHDEDWPSVRRALRNLELDWIGLPGNVWRVVP